ncbi:MAG: putative membrane protein required for colicin V [Desulfobulbaceae bacterium]|nr:MAG: putative membrane protein required for colicin V [Desulfobulbaceae bacterium]
MVSGLELTGYDLVIIAIFAFFMARGIWVGLLGQVTVIVALYVSYIVAGQYHDRLFPFLRGVSENPQIVFLLAYGILFACTYVITMLAGKGLTKVVNLTIASWFDKVLGALFGAVKALILAILLHMLLTTFLSPESPLLRKGQLYPYLSQATTLFQQVIRDDKVRQAFQKKGTTIPSQMTAPLPPPAPKPAGKPATPAPAPAEQPATP